MNSRLALVQFALNDPEVVTWPPILAFCKMAQFRPQVLYDSSAGETMWWLLMIAK